MNERPTPETDAQGYRDGRHPYVPTDFARRLERERDHYKELLNGIREALCNAFPDENTTTHDMVTMLVDERDTALRESLEQARLLGMSGSREARLIAERDEARSEVRRIQHWATVNGVRDLERQRDEARAQRDRLAEALNHILGDSSTFLTNVCIEKAQSALAAVEGGEP